LLALIDVCLASDRDLVELDVPMSDGAGLAWLYAHGEVLRRVDSEAAAHLAVRLSAADLGRFRSRELRH
jgi:GTP-binding protein HflX